MISIHSPFTDQSSTCKAGDVPIAACPPVRSSDEEFSDQSTRSVATPLKIKMATTETEKEEIYRLRYQVYIEEMEGQRRHVEADVAARQLRDEWDGRAHHFYIREDGIVVACARVVLRRDGPLECEEEFDLEQFSPAFPDHVCMTSRLALHPRIRGTHFLKQITCAIYQFWCEQGIQFSFIDCHTRLLPLYSRLGFRTYRTGFNHSKYTYVIPMVLVVNDLEHLEQVRSPFAPFGRRFSHSTEGRQLLFSKFPQSMPVQRDSHRQIVDPRDALLASLLDPTRTPERCEMLDGLTLEDVRLLSSLGHIIPCKAGSAVLREGDPGREIFLILEGSFQVRGQLRSPSEGRISISKILAMGSVFGEIRFLTEGIRYASVVAIEDSTVLILNARAMDRLVTVAPKMAAKVFRNIARIVATRLCHAVGVHGS
ncbi:MAG: cyclic nucleotide-binding domain-containing protein [Nitrospiraceae bacterium]